MLEFLRIKHPDQIKNLLKEFDPKSQTWIVSDLKSKQEIQHECLARYGFYSDDAVLRISDFWRIWIRRLKPTLNVVSSDFIKSLVQIFISQHGNALELVESDISTLEKYVQELAPIILHPQSDVVLNEWLASQENPRKWQRWYKIARVCLLYIVNEKKVIDVRWSAAFLQSLDLSLLHWPKELIVDLGTELTSVEMGLLKILSQREKVQVYVPDPSWRERFPFLFKTYDENFGFGEVKSSLHRVLDCNSEKQFLRFSTQLAEVKFAVSQVRRWLDEKIPVNQISIIALQIEDYWPVLQSYLDEEGIPYRKDIVASVNSLADTQTFLAHLKSLTQEVNFESLQQKYFRHDKFPEIKFEKFKSLFHQLFDEEDLKRDEKIRGLFYKKIEVSKDINRDEFISILLKAWADLPESSQSVDLFELLFKDFLNQSLDASMSFSGWLQFFRSRISHKEIKIGYGAEDGVQVMSLMSAQMSVTNYRVYIGLFEEAFRQQRKSILPLADIETLKNQFDLAIPYPEESHLDFNLRWQSESACEKLVFTTPHLSFSAEPLTPCLYFLENNPKSELALTGQTRLDEMQRHFSAGAGDQLTGFEDLVSPMRLKQDLFGSEVQIKTDRFKRLTASEVETYSQCSFKLLASKGFRLRDLPEVSIDLDPRQRGILVHALFDFLVQKISQNEYSVDEVKNFLQFQREQLQLFVEEDAFWGVQVNKLIHLAERFYEFERFRIQQFQVFSEKPFEIFFDLDAQKFSNQEPSRAIAIRGRIDRIDRVKETSHIIIYDYKSSAGQASSYKSWMSEYQFQLLIYLFAVETSLFEKSHVKGALFYLYKNFDLGKGIVEKNLGQQKLGLSSRLKSLTDEETLLELKDKFIEFISDCFARLDQGQFSPQPYDKTICKDCDWRKLCRAKHLM